MTKVTLLSDVILPREGTRENSQVAAGEVVDVDDKLAQSLIDRELAVKGEQKPKQLSDEEASAAASARASQAPQGGAMSN